MRLTTILALTLLCAATLHAQSRSDDLPPAARTIAGVTLNHDSLASILAKLGHTRERRVGIDHDVYTSLCYVAGEGSRRALLDLMSDASDMGTAGQELNVIRIRSDASPEERRGCALLRVPAMLSTRNGLRLGLRRAQIQKLLGPPTRTHADSLVYRYDARSYLRPGTPEFLTWNTPENRESCFDAGPPYANVAALIIVVLRDGRVAELRIERYDQSIC